MSTLQSNLFTQTDAATFAWLESCANGFPNEMASHFVIGNAGEHIRLVQVALATIAERAPALAVPDFVITGVYDVPFANAVAQYKRAKGILNFAGAIDNIVGRKTITSLDRDMSALQSIEPVPVPPVPPVPQPVPVPLSPCVKAQDCPVSQRFTLQLLGGVTGGEVVEVGAFLFDIHDLTNNLSVRYVGKVVGLGLPSPLPVAISVYGQPTPFSTGEACRVTDFFAFAISSITAPPPYPLSLSPVTLSFKTAAGLGQTLPFNLDSGPLNFPGASVHAGSLELQTQCEGQRGARRGA